MVVSIPAAVAHVVSEYRRFLRTTFRFRDEQLRRQFDDYLDKADLVVRGPYVTLSRDFERGPTLKALVEKSGADPALLRLNWPFQDQALYRHQVDAFEAGRAGRPFVVTTGTGSGKTESFLLPTLDAILRRKREGVKGVQAVFLYPMNALANDQLDRMRALIRGSGVELSYGLYTGESDKVVQESKEQAAETERLTHEAIRKDPPDILLTNYKQLEFLLIRKEDRFLFTRALRFLVLDEVHSYRGALATEIACLIRRVKAHAGLQPGELLGIGTSATVASGAGGAQALAEFATKLFGEAFRSEDIIQERTVPPPTFDSEWTPSPPSIAKDDLDIGDAEEVVRLAERLSGRKCLAEGALPARVTPALAGNRVVRALEEILATPTSLTKAAEAVRERFSDRKELPVEAVQQEIAAYLLVGSAGADRAPPRLRPKLHTFFHGVYDVWLCMNPECRRLVPQGGDECSSCGSVARPAALCRTCGQDFVKVRFVDEDDRPPAGTGNFFSDEHDGFLTLRLLGAPEDEEDESAEPKKKPGKDKLVRVGFCLDCGRVLEAGAPCGACDKPGVPYLLYRWVSKQPPKKGILHTCPSCGDTYTRGDIVTPLRSGTASTVAVLIERHLDLLDPGNRKLLVFADNRQDAAHQAGYTEDKHRTFALRHIVGRAVKEAGSRGIYLEEFPERLFEQYQKLGIVPSKPTRPEREQWREVLKFELANEFTRHARQRMSLENLGLVAVEYEFVDELADDAEFRNLLGEFGLDPGKGVNLVRAILDVMRKQRAVAYPFYQEYTDPATKRKYMEWEGEPYSVRFPERDLGPHGFALDRPAALRQSRSSSVHGFYQENPRAGQLAAPQKLAERVIGTREAAEAFLKKLVPILIAAKLLEEVPHFPIPKKDRAPGLRIYQINPKVIRFVHTEKLYRCTACQTWRGYEFPGCPTPKCKEGKLVPGFVDQDNYYVRLYADVPPHPLRVAEHSAQIADEERARREAKFKRGYLDVLVSTPTLELGVDIGELHTVVLRNAPPSPANYVQRVGRAGRRFRIGFASTFCSGLAHDRHVFDNPEWLVAGIFTPPRLRLDNVRIVHRHLRSFMLELLDQDLPARMGELLDDVVTPTRWQPEKLEEMFREVAGRRDDLAGRLEQLFARDRASGIVTRYDRGECAGVVDEFREKLLAVTDKWWRRVRQLDMEYKQYAKIGSPSHDEKKAKARKRAYFELTQDPERSYTLNYLGTQGFLPAYQFPLDTFSLDPGVADTPTLHRSSSIAIEEFAPGNFVYANGRKLKSIRVLFAGAPLGGAGMAPAGAEASGRLRAYSFCDRCDEVSLEVGNSCSRCGASMGTPVECVFADAFEAEENLRIDSSEESRQRKFFVRKESLLSGGEETLLHPYPLAPAELRRLATILITNWGPSDAKTGEGGRFYICRDCGRHQPYDPLNPAHALPLQKWKDDHRRICSGTPIPLVLGYQFETDCLVLSVPGPKDVSARGSALSATLVTLAEALLAGARSVLELEPSELGAFPRASKEEDETGEIVFYETVPGGAGYLEDLARRLPDAARAARERLFGHECGQACYLCLKHYWNQRRHRLLDKNSVRDILGAMESMDSVLPVPGAVGGAPQRLREELRRQREEILATRRPPGTRGPQSPIEQRLFEALCRIPDLPRPVAQHPIPDAANPRTVPDFAYLDAKIAIFCDGFAFHGNPETLELDARKRNWLQSKEGGGWMVLTYWGRRITRDADACAREIRDAYVSRMRGRSEGR